MKTTIQLLLVAAALLTTSAPALAAAMEVTVNNSDTSVAEMMQSKQERQLRAQFVADGNWNEVRQLDEGKAARTREKQGNRYTKANEALGRTGSAKGPDQELLINECDTEKLRIR